jgi:hypothetical protein
MRITVIAMGTRGDVQPLLALARGLQAAGHKVLFGTEASYSQAVKNENLEFYKLSGNSEAFNSGRGGKLFRDSIEKPTTKYARFWKTYVAPAVRVHLLEAAAPCQGADVLLCQPQLMIGPSLAEKFGLASVITGLFPVAELPTQEFPFPLYNGARADLSPEENCRSWRRAIPVMRVGHEAVQQWRVEVLGLRAQTFRESLECIQKTPHLLGYSNLVVPKPSEWNDRVEVAGYWFLDSAACYTPPPELEQFWLRVSRPSSSALEATWVPTRANSQTWCSMPLRRRDDGAFSSRAGAGSRARKYRRPFIVLREYLTTGYCPKRLPWSITVDRGLSQLPCARACRR